MCVSVFLYNKSSDHQEDSGGQFCTGVSQREAGELCASECLKGTEVKKGKKKLGLLDLEGALTARDRVGIQDFVLLDAHNSETAFLDNLKKRFLEDLIYTYIGTLLISVNPYKELDMYSKKHMDLYMGVNFYELPPHIYALADNAYHTMLTEANNHFILISGESGAGKTEASKKILQYYAVSCPSSALLDTVRDRMLMSNPVLEAFGNAKTLKNDNSSRFGKYMDIQFDSQGECSSVISINDKNDWKTVRNALSVVHFDDTDMEHLFGVIASVLHLGNVQFDGDTKGYAVLNSNAELRWVSKLTGVHVQILHESLTYKRIEARTDEVLCPFTVDHAIYVRDALAKAIYGRTFTWLVNRINESLENQVRNMLRCFEDASRKTVIGLLDIYGFEVFYVNSFEQFCINYCNEKLQQLFIQLTLKAEQEEYEAEGIEWEPVQFFNNKIICDLVEEKHRGIISVLDEECVRPGDATDLTFLEKLEEKMGNHPHFVTHKLADKKTRKTLDRGDFRLLHYAGEVTYCVVGFIDKNNDLLYRHIKEAMRQSKNSIIRQCFLSDEVDSRRRPETVATQFKNSLLGLTEILMAKEAWYVRCLKSNDNKQSGKFDDVLVRHQVKYLGLMEHLRVRRAGFAYRRRYEEFLKRYKPLCPATWPHWRGVPSEGVEKLVKHLGYQPDEYKMGRTKIFIRYARTLFATEDAYEICKHELATRIQAKYKGYRAKGEFKKQKEAATKIETCWRGVQARKEREKRAWAVKVIKKFIKGYMTRGQAKTTDNSEYLAFVRQSYLNRLRDNLPKTVLDKTTWLTPPPVMTETSAMLRQIHMRLMVRKYVRGITPQKKAQMQLKIITSAIFKGKKDSYPQSVAVPFVDTRISEQDINMRVLQTIRHERIKYSVPVVKYDRNGFKPRPRQLILTQSAVYLIEEAKIKQRVDYVSLTGVSVSNLGDTIMILHVANDDPKQKGDVVLQCDHLFEAVTKLSVLTKKQDAIKAVQGSIKFQFHGGKEGFVDFSTGQEPMVYKGKNGHLTVVAPRTRGR
ncbi:unconventional myosin-Ic [Astyanax mexicanus]|uniref:Unconventional myosin-Ic n=1 Tax=Astyanax mexicanus TaxID=7994 RepID=A0A8T2KUK2_ASTMX|nr:unconventional myosin-Ic [Astyanax mexicanus]